MIHDVPSCCALQFQKLDNSMQGEPLNNYPAVKAAVTMLTDGRYFSLQRQKVTVSTVGVIPKVLQVRGFQSSSSWRLFAESIQCLTMIKVTLKPVMAESNFVLAPIAIIVMDSALQKVYFSASLAQ